jgi:hypothetical protein
MHIHKVSLCDGISVSYEYFCIRIRIYLTAGGVAGAVVEDTQKSLCAVEVERLKSRCLVAINDIFDRLN